MATLASKLIELTAALIRRKERDLWNKAKNFCEGQILTFFFLNNLCKLGHKFGGKVEKKLRYAYNIDILYVVYLNGNLQSLDLVFFSFYWRGETSM